MRIICLLSISLFVSSAIADCFRLQDQKLISLKAEKSGHIFVDRSQKKFILQTTCEPTRLPKAAALSQFKKWGPIVELSKDVSLLKMNEKGATWLTFYSFGRQTGTMTLLSGKLTTAELMREMDDIVDDSMRPLLKQVVLR